ncbi:MAG: DUF6584 family protein [Acidobacteriota bacterium]
MLVLRMARLTSVLLTTFLACRLLGAPGIQDSAPSPSLQQQLGQIDALVQQNQLEESLNRLQTLRRQHPNNAAILARLGTIYFQKQDYFKALAPLRDVLRLEPDHKQATQYLGSSLYSLGKLQEATPYLEKALAWFPDNVNFLNILGLCYVQTGEPDKARLIFSRIFDIPADSPQAHFVAGVMLRQQDIWGHAEKELRRSLQLNPDMPMAHLYLGEILFSQRRMKEALAEFQEEITRNPGMWMAYYRSGEVLFETGQSDEAIPYLQRAVWLNKFFAGPYLLMGRIHLRARRFDLALDNLQRAAALDYTNANAHYLLGRALSRAGRKDEAEKEFSLSKQFRR